VSRHKQQAEGFVYYVREEKDERGVTSSCWPPPLRPNRAMKRKYMSTRYRKGQKR